MPRRFIRRLPIEQTPVKQRMLKAKCSAYCHNRQVPKIRDCDREGHARKRLPDDLTVLMTGDCGKNLWYALAQAIPEDLNANRKEDERGEPHQNAGS